MYLFGWLYLRRPTENRTLTLADALEAAQICHECGRVIEHRGDLELSDAVGVVVQRFFR